MCQDIRYMNMSLPFRNYNNDDKVGGDEIRYIPVKIYRIESIVSKNHNSVSWVVSTKMDIVFESSQSIK